MDTSTNLQPAVPSSTRSRHLTWSFGVPSLASLLRLMLLVSGVGLIISSLGRNWFDIPVAASGIAKEFGELSRLAPDGQIWFQILPGIGLTSLVVLRLLQKRWSMSCTLIACSMILAGLAFPYFVMLGNPTMAADATWLQMQHDNLTWLGGDINTAAESGQMAWKSKVYWVDPPRQIAVAPLPSWSAWEVGLDKLPDILVWLGYSNVFCQFVRAGWFHGLIGSVLLTLITLTRPGQLDLRKTGVAIVYLSVLTLTGIVFALQGPFSVKSLLQQAAEATSQGNYQLAAGQLASSARRFPVLTQDTYYIRQRGLIEHKQQIASDYARLWQATRDERSGRYLQAFDTWQALCASPDAAIRREALRAVQRFATQDYNSQRLILARQRLEFVLERQPGNVKAIYFLQVLGIREKDTASVYRMCDWMYAVADHLNFSTTKVLKAISQQNATVAAALDGDTNEIWTRMIGAKKP